MSVSGPHSRAPTNTQNNQTKQQKGAELISVINSDENKTFGAVFRTPVSDSTGIPHILEHSVLCGSRKYPIKVGVLCVCCWFVFFLCACVVGVGLLSLCAKQPLNPTTPHPTPLHSKHNTDNTKLKQEPFVELMKGSLNTFLNAFTYPDRTCYPVASTNAQDFYNLVDVYLDAVLHPKCVSDPRTFAQEGWHLELDNADDELTYKVGLLICGVLCCAVCALF